MIDAKEMSKPALRNEFAKKPDEYYKVELFDREGFRRRTCKTCGKNFWSIKETDSCGDSSHTEYSFFREKPRQVKYVDFWKEFAGFFKKNGHEEVARYPVVSRWRQDLYFTIAGIQDFQRIENGKMSFEYPANPLVIPQISLRFSDIENVGVTGRHFTSFTMANQTAFNYPKEGYWRDRTIELNFNYLTKVLGLKKEDMIYGEDVWAMGDFSEFGPSLENFAGGLEIVNSVFTQFEYVNGKVRELDGKVVDVGWGLERLMWFHSGFDSAFEVVFYDIIKKLEGRINFDIDSKLFKKFSALSSELDASERGAKTKLNALLKKAGISQSDYETKVRPTQALYAILDHTRTLLFAITDGALPSNIGGGYNLRIILRRALSFMEEYNFGFDLNEIAKLEAAELKPMFPELSENLGLFATVIDIEKKRFTRTRENASKIIETTLSKSSRIDAKQLRTLYESNGITPELIEAAAAKKNIRLEMPESSYEDIIKGDFATREKGKKLDIDVAGLPNTEQLYYKLAEESESKVLKAEKNYVILDKTPFYPEGGGQEADHGTIAGMNVVDVQKVGDVIVHVLDKDAGKSIKTGATVKCIVDKERRRRLMVHHSSVHLMSAAARSVLGKHAWQEGTRKSFDKAHIDVAHYDKLTDDEIAKLEKFINGNLAKGIKVTVKYMDRKEAEEKYGFEIYQGHGVPAQSIRMVIIEGKDGRFIDAEACGGLHAMGMEDAIGKVKIINAERISDGVDRIELVAGNAEADYVDKSLKALSESAKKLNTDQFKLPERIDSLLAERAETVKEFTDSAGEMENLIAEELSGKASNKTLVKEIRLKESYLTAIAAKYAGLNKDHVIMLWNPASGEVVCIAGSDSKADPLAFIKEHSPKGKQFKGGGRGKSAQGRFI